MWIFVIQANYALPSGQITKIVYFPRTDRELNLAMSHSPAVEELLDRLFAEDFSKSVEPTEPLSASWSDYLYEVVAD